MTTHPEFCLLRQKKSYIDILCLLYMKFSNINKDLYKKKYFFYTFITNIFYFIL